VPSGTGAVAAWALAGIATSRPRAANDATHKRARPALDSCLDNFIFDPSLRLSVMAKFTVQDRLISKSTPPAHFELFPGHRTDGEAASRSRRLRRRSTRRWDATGSGSSPYMATPTQWIPTVGSQGHQVTLRPHRPPRPSRPGLPSTAARRPPPPGLHRTLRSPRTPAAPSSSPSMAAVTPGPGARRSTPRSESPPASTTPLRRFLRWSDWPLPRPWPHRGRIRLRRCSVH
jgi:hypothetical protein